MHMSRRDSFWFLLPAGILYAVFVVLPVFMGLYFSFTNIDGMSATMNFVGLANFKRIFTDPRFWNSFINTFVFTFCFALVSNLLAIVLALFLEIEFAKLYKNTIRVLFYIPAILTPVVVGYIWYYIYKVGMPGIFTALGWDTLAQVEFVGTKLALPATIFVTIWMQAGTAMIIYIAALSNIDTSLYEAASIDGAGKLNTFWRISLPMIIPAFLINFVLSTINGFKQFDQIFTMTKGGPGNQTEVVSLLIYFKAFQSGDLAYASATAFVLFAVVTLISMLIIKYFRNQEAKTL